MALSSAGSNRSGRETSASTSSIHPKNSSATHTGRAFSGSARESTAFTWRKCQTTSARQFLGSSACSVKPLKRKSKSAQQVERRVDMESKRGESMNSSGLAREIDLLLEKRK